RSRTPRGTREPSRSSSSLPLLLELRAATLLPHAARIAVADAVACPRVSAGLAETLVRLGAHRRLDVRLASLGVVHLEHSAFPDEPQLVLLQRLLRRAFCSVEAVEDVEALVPHRHHPPVALREGLVCLLENGASHL